MTEFDALFDEMTEKEPDPIRAIDQKFFFQESEESKLRKLDRDELMAERAQLVRSLAKYKNVKNHRMREANTEIAKKRKLIKAKIAALDLDIQDLSIEQKGEEARVGAKSEDDFMKEIAANPMA